MDSQGTPSGSKCTHSRVTNLSVPNTSPSQTPSPTGVYRPQMPSPRGFANLSPPPNVMPENWGFANFSQTPNTVPNVIVDNWAYRNMLTQTPVIPYVPLSQQPTMQQPTLQQPSGSQQHSVQQPPPQAYALRDERSPSGGDDDVIPETQPSPSPSPPPQPQPKRKSRKGKKAATGTSANPTTGKAACKAWSLEEEVELAKAWVETSEDPTVVDNFWGTMKTSFDIRMGYDPDTRSTDTVMSKAKTLLSSVARFACIYNNTSNSRKSGESDVDVLTKAHGRYRKELCKVFPQEHAWKILKECPKFNPVTMLSPTDIRAPNPKRSKTSETPTDSPGESDVSERRQ